LIYGDKILVVENFPQREMGKSRDLAAGKLGVSGRTAEKAAKVVEKVDELRAEGKEKEAEELRETLNEESVNKAYAKMKEEEKERVKIHNERVVSRMVRLAGIVKYVERIPEELITFIYRDMAKLYHPDKQHGEKPEVAQKRAEAFALIADIRQILEVSDAEYRELAKSKGIIETKS
jgi:DNA polymerase II small subunit/DNA polymerase delta subunit B